WMTRLLGPMPAGRIPEAALDQAAASAELSAAEYERLRLSVRQAGEALHSERAEGAARARLYCRRAQAYERLALAHRDQGPVLASRAAGGVEEANARASVLLLAVPDGRGYKALGAGVWVETSHGRRLLTDAALARGRTDLKAFVHPSSGTRLGQPYALTVERASESFGLAVASLDPEPGLPAAKLVESPAMKGDLLRAVGHMAAAGPWSVSQGLVTAAADGNLSSDAVFDPDQAGSAVVNERGELAGLAVSGPDGPAVMSAARLRGFLAGGAGQLQADDAVPATGKGSGALLTAAAPFDEAGLQVEAGLGMGLGGVNWGGGGGLGNFRFRPSGPSVPPAMSPMGGMGGLMGNLMGSLMGGIIRQALTPAPAPRPAPQPSYHRVQKSAPRPAEQPAAEKPREPSRITGLELAPSSSEVEESGEVTLTAQIALSGPSASASGLAVSFEAGALARLEQRRAFSDGAGRASVRAMLAQEAGQPLVSARDVSFMACAKGSGAVEGSACGRAWVKILPKPMITGLSLSADSMVLALQAPVTLTAALSFTETVKDKAGIQVDFSADPERYAAFDGSDQGGAFVGRTDASGRVRVRVSLIEDEPMRQRRQTSEVKGYAEKAFAALSPGRAPTPLGASEGAALTIGAKALPGAGRLVAPGTVLAGSLSLRAGQRGEQRQSRARDCPPGMRRRLKRAATAPIEPLGGTPGQTAKADPGQLKHEQDCRAMEQAAFDECGLDENCLNERLGGGDYAAQDCQARLRGGGGAQPGSPGILAPPSERPPEAVVGDDCVRIDAADEDRPESRSADRLEKGDGEEQSEAPGGESGQREEGPLRGKKAADLAAELGYGPRIPSQKLPFDSHGQPGFRRGNRYITPDVDSHSGGIWKMFDGQGHRLGTFDSTLNRIGD
ncbi:MAG: toxin C-terminal domain-containing protein, partial [Elusimicrobia bacterium]|nr:toxin C-terminal domain-containing protein [Elusimicrobiota bacterium]